MQGKIIFQENYYPAELVDNLINENESEEISDG